LAWCQAISVQYTEHWPVEEQVLAENFVRSFGPESISTFQSICQLCTRLDIEVSVRSMPTDIRGHNHLYENKRVILVSEHQTFPGANEHTVLHELREMVEHVFVDLGLRTCSSMEELETRAEQFASIARSEAFGYTLLVFWKNAEQIEKKWARYGAYALIGVGGLAYLFGLLFLPILEDAWPSEEMRKRNVRM
jgi:hypothetical protein